MGKTVKYAFLRSLPVMAGYLVLGLGFGVLLAAKGYGVGWAFAMSALIYAGSMQYVAVDMLAGGASLVTAALMTLTVNARHLFYGISMVERYRDAGPAKPYLIFALTDETYSLVCSGEVPQGWTGRGISSWCRSSITCTGSPAAWWGRCWGPCCPLTAPASTSP